MPDELAEASSHSVGITQPMNAIPDLVPLYDNRPGLRSLLQVEVRGVTGSSADDTAPCLDFVASTATLDRYHEIIEPAGWRLDSYRKNPVFQNAHNYGDILFTLGRALTSEVRVIGGKSALCQRIEFATEVNPIARIAYGLYKGGFLNAVSVGFIPLKWEDGKETKSAECRMENGESHLAEPSAAEPDRLTTLSSQLSTRSSPRRRYLEQELLEVSAVAIPANPDALTLGVKTGAISKSDLQATLDLLHTLAGAQSPQIQPQPNPLLNLACELRRVMRRA